MSALDDDEDRWLDSLVEMIAVQAKADNDKDKVKGKARAGQAEDQTLAAEGGKDDNEADSGNKETEESSRTDPVAVVFLDPVLRKRHYRLSLKIPNLTPVYIRDVAKVIDHYREFVAKTEPDKLSVSCHRDYMPELVCLYLSDYAATAKPKSKQYDGIAGSILDTTCSLLQSAMDMTMHPRPELSERDEMKARVGKHTKGLVQQCKADQAKKVKSKLKSKAMSPRSAVSTIPPLPLLPVAWAMAPGADTMSVALGRQLTSRNFTWPEAHPPTTPTAGDPNPLLADIGAYLDQLKLKFPAALANENKLLFAPNPFEQERIVVAQNIVESANDHWDPSGLHKLVRPEDRECFNMLIGLLK